MKYIYIKADTNDGDFVYKLCKITDKELEQIQPVIDTIKANHGDFECLELGDSAQVLYGNIPGFDQFYKCVPTGECGIHTIESIEVFDVIDSKKLM